MIKGFDTAQPILQRHIGALQDNEARFVGRYYSYNDEKNLSPEEALRLTGGGIAIVSVFEAKGDRYASFDAQHGRQDAAQALRLAGACGQPLGTAIYFAVDFDASEDELAGGVRQYFQAVQAGIAGRYRIGVYGSGLACRILGNLGIATLFWLSGARGWAESRSFTRWHIRQGGTTTILDLSLDVDDAVDGDFGQWRRAGVPTPAVITIPSAREMQTALAAQRLYTATVDGIWGPLSQAALAAYYEGK